MITRLQIDGFKNLVKVDIRFGPFTCIAGLNAVGKSNLFDAIRFLSDLSQKSILEAAKTIRSEGQKNADIRSIFHKYSSIDEHHSNKMNFVVDMIIPETGVDELGQEAIASITTVKYVLSLKLISATEGEGSSEGRIEILEEELLPITQTEAKKEIDFDASTSWKKSVIKGRRSAAFISTVQSNNDTVIRLHQDREKGRTFDRKAESLPRTVLSTIDTSQSPTALIVKREMQSWQLLQLEPTALRQSDELYGISQAKLSSNGLHLPATLLRLKRNYPDGDILKQISNKLAQLVDDIRDVNIETDKTRELVSLVVTDNNGINHYARALSDGTLRFLGLTVLEKDYENTGVICLEEPENGIHPQKIEAIIKLLQDIATDTSLEVGIDNPLRQVIINTHSPLVVKEIPEDSLLMAESVQENKHGIYYKKVVFKPLDNTWRSDRDVNVKTVSLGKMVEYLYPYKEVVDEYLTKGKKQKRVIDRKDISKGIQFELSFNED